MYVYLLHRVVIRRWEGIWQEVVYVYLPSAYSTYVRTNEGSTILSKGVLDSLYYNLYVGENLASYRSF